MKRKHNGQKKTVQKDKQRSTKHTYKTKDRVTRTPLKPGGEHVFLFYNICLSLQLPISI
jgi:hypothetical protein